MKIAVYTIPYEIHNEIKKIHDLFENGLECLHLRKPGYSKSRIIAILDKINPDFHDRIVLHSHYSLALKYDLRGIHIPLSNFISELQAKFIKSWRPKINVSATVSRAKGINGVPSVIDRLQLGPLYVKYSEENFKRRFEPMEVSGALNKCELPVHAMGGIEVDHVEGLEKLGFDGITLQTSIWKTEDVLNSFKSYTLAVSDIKGRVIPLAV